MSRLATKISSLNLKNPVMNASGILGLTAYSMKRLAQSGVAAVVTKSIGKDARPGNPNPTVVGVECGLLNSMGLPNLGVDEAFNELQEAVTILDVPLIVSIYGFSPKEFLEVSKKLDNLNISAFELNVSCPHVEKLGFEIGQNMETIAEVVKNVKSATRKPVFIKLSPNVSNIVDLARAAVDSGVDGITAINTVRAMSIDVESGKPILNGRFGGLSGPAIKPIAIRCVYEIFESLDIPIIGCGGITRWEDAAEFLMAGASAVQIGTAILYKDLTVFMEIIQGLNDYVKRKNLKNLSSIVGIAHKN